MKKGIIIILALVMAFMGIPVFAMEQESASWGMNKYADISGHWAERAIGIYGEQEIFADSEGRFLPQKPITRSEFVWMLHKALGVNIQYFMAPDIGEYFSDVSNDAPYATNLYDLATLNIIDDRGVFGPGESLPREEMVHLIMNALENRLGGSLPDNQIIPEVFKDGGQISADYKLDVNFALTLSLINGRGNGMFEPKAACTRAEAAVMMLRLMDAANRISGEVDVLVTAVPEADRITMSLFITNNSLEPVVLDYTSGQRYDFALLDSNKNVLYRWSADKLFIQALSSMTIAPGESIGYSDELSGEAYISIKDKISFMTAFITGQSKSFTINDEGYQIIVNY